MSDPALKARGQGPQAQGPQAHGLQAPVPDRAGQAIVLDEIFPHAPAVIWKALTTGALIARWMMEPTGFEPVVGKQFTFKTTPAGAWDGFIRCEVLEVVPNERFAYAWRGGHEDNVGYGSRLDTIVTFMLTKVETGTSPGTRLRLIHAGFVLPTNDTVYKNLGGGWPKCFVNLRGIADEEDGGKST